MSWTFVDPARIAPTPWKNGGGSTRELLAWPGAADWRVRISMAQVDRAGPFSAYPGVQRWFGVLEGAGVRLRIGEQAHELTAQSPPIEFDGAVPVDCDLLDGATTDLNLMVKGGGGRMRRLQGMPRVAARRGQLVAACTRDAMAWRILDADETLEVPLADAWWMEANP